MNHLLSLLDDKHWDKHETQKHRKQEAAWYSWSDGKSKVGHHLKLMSLYFVYRQQKVNTGLSREVTCSKSFF